MRERSSVDIAGDHLRRASGRTVVGLLVSRCGTRRRGIYRATHLQREGREKRIVIGPVVQPRALRAAALAVDFDGSCGSRSLPGACATGARLHVGGDTPDPARGPGNSACGVWRVATNM